MRTPIAYYVRWKAAAVLALMFGIVFASVWAYFFYKGGLFEEHRTTAMLFGYVGIFASAFTLFAAVELLDQFLFHDGMAVWIEDGTVVMVHRWLFSANCKDVERVFYGLSQQFRKKGVVLHLYDGTEKCIPTHALREPEYVVVERLIGEIRQITGHDVQGHLA